MRCKVKVKTHGDSGSSRAVVHQGQLPKRPLVVVLKQQLLLVAICLGDLEVAAFYDVEVVALLSFPEGSSAILDCMILPSGCLVLRLCARICLDASLYNKSKSRIK